MSIIVNWAHVSAIEEVAPTGNVNINFANAAGWSGYPAKDILVVGEGSMRVNLWLTEIAGNSEQEGEDERS